MSSVAKNAASMRARDDLAEHAGANLGVSSSEAGALGTKGQSKSVQREVARYIGQMAAELSGMARKSDFDLLAYFLEMARVESRALVRKFEHNTPRPR